MQRSIKALVSLAHVAIPSMERGFANLPDDVMPLVELEHVYIFRFSINVRILDIGGTAVSILSHCTTWDGWDCSMNLHVHFYGHS